MKVFNLCCEHDHGFEGWFSSAEDYDRQVDRSMIECPMCGSTQIRKMPAAPRLNLSATQKPAPPAAASQPPTPEQVQATWMKLARHLAAHTEDVGEKFADEARKIHYRESPERGIRGVASAKQAAELEEEGIEVFAFPMPNALKKPLQ